MKRNGGLVSKMTRLLKGGFFHILVGNVLNKAISMVSSIAIVRLVDKARICIYIIRRQYLFVWYISIGAWIAVSIA